MALAVRCSEQIFCCSVDSGSDKEVLMRKGLKGSLILLAAAAMLTGSAMQTMADDDKVITFWNIGTADTDAKLIQYAIDEFNATTESGYTIESVSMANDQFKDKLIIAMSSGECPDMYISWTGGPMIEYIKSGYAVPIDEQYEKYGLNDRIMDAATAQGTYDGHIYAVASSNISVAGIYYNQEIFDKYGIEVPKTVSELEAACDTLVENGVIPFALANASKWTGSMYYQLLVARYAGLDKFQAAATGEGSFEDECFTYAGTKIQEWVQKGYFPEGFNSMSEDDTQSEAMFFKEETAMYLIGSWETPYFEILSNEAGNEFYKKVGWFNFPAVDGAEDVDPSIMCGTVGDMFINFNCEGEKLDAAVEFASCYSRENVVDQLVDIGFICPVKGIEEKITDPISQQILTACSNASAVQLWWDQYLAPEVANAHLDSSQEVFGLTMTPEEANAVVQKASEEYLQKQ